MKFYSNCTLAVIASVFLYLFLTYSEEDPSTVSPSFERLFLAHSLLWDSQGSGCTACAKHPFIRTLPWGGMNLSCIFRQR